MISLRKLFQTKSANEPEEHLFLAHFRLPLEYARCQYGHDKGDLLYLFPLPNERLSLVERLLP